MTSPKDDDRKPQPGPPDEEADVQERLSALFGEDDAAEGKGEPRIRLDKTGALADRPKLAPKKPYAREDAPEAETPGVRALDDDARPGAPRKAQVPPPIGTLRPPGFDEETATPPDDEVRVSGGTFLFGEEKEAREVPAFRIDRHPVRNAEYEAFVKATGHRPPLYWIDGKMPPELAEHPVVGVDYFDALAYARWRGKDLPFEDEWERAARGTDGRTYPWGDEVELGQANTARLGLKMTMPVGWYEMNVSPDGVWDTMGNVWEITHSPAPGGGIVVRGGSWFDFVLYAKTWFRFASRPEARNGTIGFRCVRRMKPRQDVEREVAPEEVEDALAARRGPQPKVDVSTFSPERRDLVPDYRRLHQLVTEREEEEAEARDAALLGRAPTGRERPLRTPVKATPPPRLPKPPRPPAPAPAPAPAAPSPPKAERREPAPPPPRPAPPPPPPPPAPPPPPPTKPPPAPASTDDTGGPTGAGSRLGTWLVVATALVLVAALLGILLAQGKGGDGASSDGPTPREDVATTTPALPRGPEAVDPRDAEPPTILDLGDPDVLATIRRGVWVLVFADLPGADGEESVGSADRLHRVLRDTSAGLALVLPRALFEGEDGRLVDGEAQVASLRALGATSDVTVLLDPAAPPPTGGRLRTAYDVVDPQAALVIVDGVRRHRTTPPDGGFTDAMLEPLAARATEVGGSR